MAGHLGKKKTTDRILRRFYWPRMFHDIKEYCKSCPVCQKTSPNKHKTKAKLIPLPVIGEPFSRIAMDIVGPLDRSSSGNQYILVVCDYATRYPEAVPMRSCEAEKIAEEVLKIFSRVGVPKEILTDQGTNFLSKFLAKIYHQLGIRAIKTSPYHPQCDGLTERFNGTLVSMLRKVCKDNPKIWDKMLPYILFAYREVPQVSTGFSPFELVYGRDVRGPLDVLKESFEEPTEDLECVTSYLLRTRDTLRHISELAQENLKAAQTKQKLWYDKGARVKEFQQGQHVLVLLPSSTSKLHAEWQGPYKITKKISAVNYQVNMEDKQKNLRIFHVNMLKEWHLLTNVSYYGKATCPSVEESDSEKLDDIPTI